MPRKYLEHLFSILFITIIFLILVIVVRSGEQATRQREYDTIAPYLNLAALDIAKPFDKTLFRESLEVFYPGATARNDSLVELMQRYATRDLAEIQQMLRSGPGLTWSKFVDLTDMYISFILAYLMVMGLTYYGVQSLATYRFVREKQRKAPYLVEFVRIIRVPPPGDDRAAILAYVRTAAVILAKAIMKGIGYLVLFSPAYVLAYTFRSRFDTDAFVFMVLLGAVSNGLLITYTQKFYTFLVAESRKGWVQTAIVKNLNASYFDLPLRTILQVNKNFQDHILQHIYLNARHQYIPTLKEQASFLITGLIIIEMALNIHGHLCYELLQNILYEQYDVVLTILLGLFLVVKSTEIAVDRWTDYEAMKYENR